MMRVTSVIPKPNLVAAYFIKRDLPPDHPDVRAGVRFRGLNQWPDDLPGFRETALEYQGVMEALARGLLPLYARAAELPPDFFHEPFREADVTLRLSHYPPMPADAQQFGLAPHTDSSFLTMLPDNAVPGLEIRPAGSDWMAAPSLPGAYLVNSGDTLKRWTNDRFLSTEHRVRPSVERDRYAAPFFFSPRHDYVMECLPTCHGPGRPPRFQPFTYGQYIAWFADQNYHGRAASPAPP